MTDYPTSAGRPPTSTTWSGGTYSQASVTLTGKPVTIHAAIVDELDLDAVASTRRLAQILDADVSAHRTALADLRAALAATTARARTALALALVALLAHVVTLTVLTVLTVTR